LFKTDYEKRETAANPSWPPPAGHPKGEPLSTGLIKYSPVINSSKMQKIHTYSAILNLFWIISITYENGHNL
jgi:hypothetical protein